MNKRQAKSRALARFLGAALALLTAAPAALAQPDPPPPALAAARVEAAQQELLQAPSWGALAAAWRLLEPLALWDPAQARARCLELAAALEAQRPDEGRRLAAALLRHRAASLALDLGLDAQARQERAALGLLEQWQIIGPFENSHQSGFDAAAPPERQPFDPQAAYDGKVGPVSWRRTDLGLHGHQDLAAAVNPDQGVVVYAAAAIDAERPLDAVLRVGVDGAYKIWLNGAPVARVEADTGARLDAAAWRVKLRRGRNHLLLKVAGETRGELGFTARLTSPLGAPLTLKTAAPDPGAALASPGAPPKGAAWPAPWEAANADADAAKDTRRARALMDAARLARTLRPRDPATPWRDQADLAVSLQPQDPWLLTEGAALQPQHWRRLEKLRAAAAAAPEDPWALSQLAEALHQNLGVGHLPEIIELSKKSAEISERNRPGQLAAGPRLRQARALSGQGLHGAALAILEPLAEALPRCAPVLEGLRDVYRAAARERDAFAVELRLAALRQRGSAEQLTIARARLREGRPADALMILDALLAGNPGAFQGWLLRARALEQLERLPEALEALDALLARSPGLVSALREQGRLLERAGRPDEAARSYEAALRISPEDRGLVERVQALRPLVASYEAPWRLGDEALIPGPDAAARHPGQDFYYLARQDVLQVSPSGRATRFVQEIVHVLTDEGAKAWDNQRMYYSPGFERVELVSVRVRKPDGTLNEAWRRDDYDAGKGDGNLYYLRKFAYVTVPTLTPGDVVEYAWREVEESGENFREGYFGDIWYFEASADVELARYVVLSPSELPLHVRAPALPGLRQEEQALTWQERPHKARVFEARDLRRVRADEQMPGRAEVFAYILVSTYQSWDQVGLWWWNLIKEQLVVDAEMERLVKELTEGISDRREKVRAIHNWVVKNTRYVGIEFGVHGWKPYRTTLCLRRRFGDCKDKASLIKVMLDAAGVEARLVLIRTRALGDVAEAPANLSIFNHAIAYVPEFDLFLDGTAEFSGTRELPFSDQGQLALIVADGGAVELRRTPVDAPAANRFVRALRVDLGQQPALVRGELTAEGADAAYFRSRLENPEERDEFLARTLSETWPGAKLREAEYVEVSDIERPVKVSFVFEGGGFVKQSGEQSFALPAGRDIRLLDRYAAQATRAQDLLLGVPYELRQEISYTLAEDAAVDALPSPLARSGPFGAYALEVRREGRQVSFVVTYSISVERVKVSDYAAFRAWLAEVDRALNQPMTLKTEAR
jgi:transglutaminase-like putative cysteine protease